MRPGDSHTLIVQTNLSFMSLLYLLTLMSLLFLLYIYRVSPKNALSEFCWSQSALAQSLNFGCDFVLLVHFFGTPRSSTPLFCKSLNQFFLGLFLANPEYKLFQLSNYSVSEYTSGCVHKNQLFLGVDESNDCG